MAEFKTNRFMNDSILSDVSGLGVTPDAMVANLPRSGQLGTGIRTTKLDAATPAVFNPAVGIVLTVPTMWDKSPKLQEMLKSVMETHAKSITGIDFSYSLETQDTPVGHDGQTMKVPTRTTRSAINPSASFIEYPGMPIYNLFKHWMFDIQHPDTNSSWLPSVQGERNEIPAWQMSAYSMSMLFIQYDPTGLPDRIYDAIVVINMFPTEIGEIGIERQIGTTQTKERQITFSGIVQHNDNTKELGYRVAEMLALHKINYQNALPGLTGSVEPSIAIQTELNTMGGLGYEAGTVYAGTGADYTSLAEAGGKPSVPGAVDQFTTYDHTGTDDGGQVDSGEVIPQTGAAISTMTK